jgi:hypothetical protein
MKKIAFILTIVLLIFLNVSTAQEISKGEKNSKNGLKFQPRLKIGIGHIYSPSHAF